MQVTDQSEHVGMNGCQDYRLVRGEIRQFRIRGLRGLFRRLGQNGRGGYSLMAERLLWDEGYGVRVATQRAFLRHHCEVTTMVLPTVEMKLTASTESQTSISKIDQPPKDRQGLRRDGVTTQVLSIIRKHQSAQGCERPGIMGTMGKAIEQ